MAYSKAIKIGLGAAVAFGLYELFKAPSGTGLPTAAGGAPVDPATLGTGTPGANANTMTKGNRFMRIDGTLMIATGPRQETNPPSYLAYNTQNGQTEVVPITSINNVVS